MTKLNHHENRRVLVIDDNPSIHDDFRKILSPATSTAAAVEAAERAIFGGATDSVPQIEFEVDSAYQGQEGVLLAQEALAAGRPYAMAFVDVRMPPGWDGIETTRKLWEEDPNLQVVLCTAYSDYSWDKMFERLGPRDNLLILKKPFDAVEALQLAQALTEKWWLRQQFQRKMEELEDRVTERTCALQQTNHALQTEVTEHARAEDKLRLKTAFLEAMVDTPVVGILVVDQEGNKSLQNQRFVDLFKIPPSIADEKTDENQFRWVADMTKDPAQYVEKVGHLYAHPNESSHDEIELKDGTTLERYSAPVVGKDEKYSGRVWTFRDITKRKRFEAQLMQAQRLETVGRLAGGIAHEFNSILTAIIGQSELLIWGLPAGSPLAKNATEIRQAAGRAATLTRQLLAYGRKQILQPEILNLNHVLASMKDMFHHITGDDVETLIVPAPGLHAVKADAGQIEQVILNMVVNARDAMPNGGKLTLETANVSLDPESVGRFPELKAGEYVRLAISDTGAGMSEKVKARLFEPFFSTKGVGKGTGLELSTCYGIIKQSGGHISVYSELGRGAAFKIYLPQAQEQTTIPISPLDSSDSPRGTETVLLVEDDPALREMEAALLRRLGYTVWAAANGIEALTLKQQGGIGHIDLLFTDVVMPHMSGRELADRVRALHPQVRILFSSAYTENAIVHQGVLNKDVTLLQKPFTPSALAHKLRQVLDQPLAAESGSAPNPLGLTKTSAQARTPGD
jgi:signal transduction histidine kinase/DNA-binding NtrC family response regulator